VTWTLQLAQGRLVYLSDSVSHFDRLERLLKRLGCQASARTAEAHAKAPNVFPIDPNSPQGEDPGYQAVCWLLNQKYLDPEQSATLLREWTQPDTPPVQDASYQAICWLFTQQLLTPLQVTSLIEESAKEIMEMLLLLSDGTFELTDQDHLGHLPKFCKLELTPLLNHALQRIKAWQTLGPQIWSPYQRPYFFSQSNAQQKITPELQQRLGSLLKGLSFRHLATLLNKDELQLAQSLRTYILDGIVYLREPQPPFDRLPRIPAEVEKDSTTTGRLDATGRLNVTGNLNTNQLTTPAAQRSYTIACVDDSPTMLREISRFLGEENFTVVAINEPVKALMQIIRSKPDMILLDVGMPGMDGYELCRLLRNHPLFKTTPVVMVTGHTGILDRAKAKLVGATDYLTKPFTQSGLLKMVFKYLTP
jgi:twitching motility two-component system response regulator PilG